MALIVGTQQQPVAAAPGTTGPGYASALSNAQGQYASALGANRPAAPTGGYQAMGTALPWNPASNAQAAGMAMSNPAAAYGILNANAYNVNQAMYGNEAAGWNQTRATQARQLANVSQGYTTLGNQVQQTIAGTDAAAKQQIADQYQQQMGASQQALINSGLGNSTVTSSVNRGLTLDESKAYANLADQFAQLQAGYQSQIGQAGLGFRGQSVLANSQLAQNQLGWMNSVNAGYPDLGLYASMNQANQGMALAERDRQEMMKKYGGMGGGNMGGGGAVYPGSTGGGATGHETPKQAAGGGNYGGYDYGTFHNPYAPTMGGQGVGLSPPATNFNGVDVGSYGSMIPGMGQMGEAAGSMYGEASNYSPFDESSLGGDLSGYSYG